MRHIYVHIPFCARICPYCAFYKERADPAQATRFCEAILAELHAVSLTRFASARRFARRKLGRWTREQGLHSRASQRGRLQDCFARRRFFLAAEHRPP